MIEIFCLSAAFTQSITIGNVKMSAVFTVINLYIDSIFNFV